MNWKEFFKPTKGKIIFSIIITSIWFLLIIISRPTCKLCGDLCFNDWPEIIPSCDCCIGSTFPEFVIEIIIAFVAPLIISYLVYSSLIALKGRKK